MNYLNSLLISTDSTVDEDKHLQNFCNGIEACKKELISTNGWKHPQDSLKTKRITRTRGRDCTRGNSAMRKRMSMTMSSLVVLSVSLCLAVPLLPSSRPSRPAFNLLLCSSAWSFLSKLCWDASTFQVKSEHKAENIQHRVSRARGSC